MNMLIFENRSTTTKIESKSFDKGSCEIKSIEIDIQGPSGIHKG